jgi:hypothetical protein
MARGLMLLNPLDSAMLNDLLLLPELLDMENSFLILGTTVIHFDFYF